MARLGRGFPQSTQLIPGRRESAATFHPRTTENSVSLSEDVTRQLTLIRGAAEQVGGVLHVRTAGDTIAALDLGGRTITAIRSVSDAVDTAESATRIITPQSGARLKRSIPSFSTATVDFLLANGDALNLGADGDIFLLAVGGSNNAVTSANISWVNTQANRLKAAYPNNPVGFHTSGTDDVQTLAQQTNANVTIGNFNYEINFGTESEPFSLNPTVVEGYFDLAHDYCIADGKIPVCSPSGRFFPWSSLTVGGFDASDLGYDWMPAIIGSGVPCVIQCQTWAKSQAAGTDQRFNDAWEYMKVSPGANGAWFPQITISTTEVNGVTDAEGLDVLNSAIAAYGRPDGISVWSNSTMATMFRNFLLQTKDL